MSSPRKRKKKQEDGGTNSGPVTEAGPLPKKAKGCDRKACQLTYCDPPPLCFCHATDKCAQGGHTSRWYHLSAGQHYCNECFEHFYRSHKPGHKLYEQWSSVWEKEAGDTLPPRASQFMSDMWLPIWVQCTTEGCGRWRKLPAHIELHHVKLDVVKCSDCTLPEDPVATMATDPLWIHTLSYTPLLRYCDPLASLLVEYYPDGVGISPTTVSLQRKKEQNDSSQESIPSTANGRGVVLPSYDWLHPFNHPKEGPRGGAFTPDNLELSESQAFPEWTKSPALEVYLIMRNVAVALWFADCRQLVTVERCMGYLRLRGTVRIWCFHQYGRVLHFLSRKGYINTGLLPTPHSLVSMHPVKKQSVIIVGAGPSGLAAARHLDNFGYNVTILEAANRIGGRVLDDTSFRHCVGQGAMFVTGVVNNPITLLSRQRDAPLRLVNEDKCELILERGGVVADPLVDKNVEAQFNSTLDQLANWRSTRTDGDASLESKLTEFHSQLLAEQGCTYSEDEKGLFDFHLSNLEFACGAHLSQISASHWDHNDNFPQFNGPHALVESGLGQLIAELLPSQEQLKLNSQVTCVEISNERVTVRCKNDTNFEADKVIITVPLAILKEKQIEFVPSLSADKQQVINRLGAGVVEKVALKFKTPFWRDKLGNADIFGHVATTTERRGLFSVFYDLSSKNSPAISSNSTDSERNLTVKEKEQVYILMTTVSGLALDQYNSLTDEEIRHECMSTLRVLFPNQPVPEPESVLVSHWGRDPFAMMSYSYVAVGSASEDYDLMSQEEIMDRVHFAGEATNRWYPQSVTGAYLSGIREACKIIEADFFNAKISRRN